MALRGADWRYLEAVIWRFQELLIVTGNFIVLVLLDASN